MKSKKENASEAMSQDVKKMYISMPITGQEENVKERYEEILSYCEQNYPEYDLVFPYDIEYLLGHKSSKNKVNRSYTWYMGKDLMLLSECDAILMTQGWLNSLGCNIEKDCAVKDNMIIRYMI